MADKAGNWDSGMLSPEVRLSDRLLVEAFQVISGSPDAARISLGSPYLIRGLADLQNADGCSGRELVSQCAITRGQAIIQAVGRGFWRLCDWLGGH